MNSIFSYKNNQTKNVAYKKVKRILTPEYLSQFKIKNEVSYHDESFLIKAVGKGFELMISFQEKTVEVKLQLSLLYKPFQGKVYKIIKKELEKVL